jgi:hypothetical protein
MIVNRPVALHGGAAHLQWQAWIIEDSSERQRHVLHPSHDVTVRAEPALDNCA